MTKNLRLIYRDSPAASASPYRLIDSKGKEVRFINDFLDVQCIRGLSQRTLRSYGFDLLNFAKWHWQSSRRDLCRLNQSQLHDYVRYQLDSKPKPTPQTINHRLVVLQCLYRFHCGHDIPGIRARIRHAYRFRDPHGYGQRRPALAGLRLKQPRRVVVPLSAEEVSQFWRSFRTYRDIGLIALMLFDGLRSREVIELELDDLTLPQAELRVHGKGNKERIVPLSDETLQVLEHYIQLERPLTPSPHLFVSLKRPHRGHSMTPAGLRSLFRHHRKCTEVLRANPHRFRHTFGADMVRAGVSLPALMLLMGHSNIRSTMLYVQLSPKDVWREYHRAVERKAQLAPPEHP